MAQKTVLNNIPLAFREFIHAAESLLTAEDVDSLREYIRRPVDDAVAEESGINPLWRSLVTAAELCRSVAPDRNMVEAIMLFPLSEKSIISLQEIRDNYGDDVATLVD